MPGIFIMSFVLLLDDVTVDECSNEDPGPLPGPRSIYLSVFLPNSITIGAASESQDIRDL